MVKTEASKSQPTPYASTGGDGECDGASPSEAEEGEAFDGTLFRLSLRDDDFSGEVKSLFGAVNVDDLKSPIVCAHDSKPLGVVRRCAGTRGQDEAYAEEKSADMGPPGDGAGDLSGGIEKLHEKPEP